MVAGSKYWSDNYIAVLTAAHLVRFLRLGGESLTPAGAIHILCYTYNDNGKKFLRMAQIPQLLAEYISLLSPQRSERIQVLHQFIVRSYPRAELTLKYKMPTYEMTGGWVSVANQKHYISVYSCAREHIQPYLDRHPETRCGTGCLNFRDSDTLVLHDLKPVLNSAFSKHKAFG